jgi:hypothetical protein
MNYIYYKEIYNQLNVGEYILKNVEVYYKPECSFLYKYNGKLLELIYIIDHIHESEITFIPVETNVIITKMKRMLKYHQYKQNKAVT